MKKTPWQEGAEFYKAEWQDTLCYYVENHFVYASPTALVLAKPEDDHWWIEFAAGNMEEMFGHLPFWLPNIHFNRKGVVKAYAMAHIVNRILKNDSVPI